MELRTGEDYVRSISLGNKAAFDQFFREYYLLMKGYCQRIVKDIVIAEDIVQETFFNIWLKHEQLDNVKNLSAYVRTMVHNASISYLRKKGRDYITIDNSNIYEFEILYSDILQYQETYLNKELSLKIGEAIDHLPGQCRTIFILSRSFGFKNKEIAVQLDISVKAVEKQITKALSFLRDHLKDYMVALMVYLAYS